MTPAETITPARRLALSTKLFYGFGSVAFGVKNNGFSYLLLLYYNQVVGLSPSLVGGAIMIAMAVDAILDPVVGQISDNWRSRWGRRHPFMYAAALPVALSYLALWNPPHGSPTQLFWYLVVISIIIRSFITFYEVPSAALSAELTQDYDERTSLQTYRLFFSWIGGLTLYLITFKFLLVPDAHHAVGQTNPVGFARYGLYAALIMFAAIVISAVGTHRHIPSFRVAKPRHFGLVGMARDILGAWSNRSFLFITLCGLGISMGMGLAAAMDLYIITFYWEFTSDQLATLVMGVFASPIVALAATNAITRRVGKRAAAVMFLSVSVGVATAPMLLRLAGVLPPNHTALLFQIIFVQSIIFTAFGISGSAVLASMVADVVEDGELKTGRRAEGVYFSASSLVAKAVSGMGIFAASTILTLVHFPANAKPGHVSPQVIRHFAMVYAPAVIALYGLGLVFLLGYRITRSSHQTTLARLAQAASTAP